MEITYCKEGMKIKHPSGVEQVFSVENLISLREKEEELRAEQDKSIAELNAQIAEVQKIVK